MTDPTPELATSLTIDDNGRLLEAEADVRSRCGWHIAPARTDDLIVDGSGGPVLFIPSMRVTAVAAIVEDGNAVDLDGVDWSETGILTKRAGCWTTRPRGVVVTLTHGYDPVPADLAGLVRAIATRISADGKTIKARTTGPFSETYDGVEVNELEIIARYRIPNVN